MAIVKNNIATEGLSGKLGGQLVFRQSWGKTIVSTPPRNGKHCSKKQHLQRMKFKDAILYAKEKMQNPELRTAYNERARKKGYPSGYNAAIADFCNAPVVGQMDASAYRGQIGDPIWIEAIDDFKVHKVEVCIQHQDGSQVESGGAMQQPDEQVWLYKTTTPNKDFRGDQLVVKAFDIPGNEAVQEQTL